MKTGKSLIELATEIERRANGKRDFVTKTDALALIPQSDESGVKLMLDGGERFDVNSIAHGQIASHTDIPKPYYDRMLANAPHLLTANVNHWFRTNEGETRMVRTLDGKARAFLSNKYRPLENEDLAEAVLPALRDLDLEIMSSEITESRLYIKAVERKVVRELEAKGGKFGDGKHNIVRMLSPAITISNSEVGLGSMSILVGLYDGFCSNLATFGERSARKYHVGGKHELLSDETFAMLSDDTRRKTDAALWAQMRDVTKLAFDKTAFNSLCDKVAETATHKIEGDPVKVIELASKRFSFSKAEGTSVLRHLIEGGDLSRFGLYNAVTRTAQDADDYDRATELERLGAGVIELPKNEWQELAKAA